MGPDPSPLAISGLQAESDCKQSQTARTPSRSFFLPAAIAGLQGFRGGIILGTILRTILRTVLIIMPITRRTR